VCQAVAAVHAAGYLHRDIKSDNVMLARAEDGGAFTPKLIDFGIACPIDNPDTPLDGVAGTPRVMAPEQVAREAVDERTDIWGLGVMLYEMLTGELPFEDMLATVAEDAPALPASVDPGVRALVEACLAKDPDERPWSARDLADDLRDRQ
jgi:serine/threonine-protein kinase